LDLAATFPEATIFSPVVLGNTLPYMNESVDIVAVGPGSSTSAAEVNRIAKSAVMRFSPHRNGFGHDPGLEIEWKQVVSNETRKISIVIASSGNSTETETCLTAVRDTLPRYFDGELILVDSGTAPESNRLLRLVRADARVKILRSRKAKDLPMACNLGAKASTGDVLIFVSGVMLPFGDWLPPLLQLLIERPEAGAVGGKLIDPDGTLLEAGGIIFSNGMLDGFGHHAPQVDAPLYSFVREVDYCSLEFLATRRLVFEGVGGLDSEFPALNYAAADYGLRVRREGHRVLYQPESAATYLNARHGPDGTNHMGGAQHSSRNTLITRWAETLRHKPAYVNSCSSAAWHDFAGRL
jgi:GT2 family glycosyltransferase